MNTIALIGARSSGSSLRDKNIRVLGGHPLLAYSIVAAQKAGIERVIVSSDSYKYLNIASSYGALCVDQIPAVSTAESTDYDWINYVLARVEPCDLIVHLRPTTPLRSPILMREAMEWIALHPLCSAMRSVEEMSETAYKCLEIGDNGNLKHSFSGSYHLDNANKPRQAFPRTFHANGYIDVLRADRFIKNHQKLHGHRVLSYVTKRTVEIDTEEDFAFAEYQVERNPELVRRLFE